MLRAYKYRLFPNITQSIGLSKTFGCVRYFWNKQAEIFNSYNKETNEKVVYKTSTEFRNEIGWMREVSAAALQQKEIDFKEYKKQKFNKKRKEKIGKPIFKKRHERQSFRLPNGKFSISDNRIRIEKVGKIKFIQDRPLPENCKLMSVTVSKDTTGAYYASVLVETQITYYEKTGKSVGVDVGVKSFAKLSDGTEIKNPHFFRDSQAKLKRAQRRLRRKQKGSRRRNKCRLKVAKLYKQTANQRNHFLQEESTRIVKNYDIIRIEDLNVEGMLKNRKLAKSIADASFSKFFLMLEYKCIFYGKTLIKIPRFYPSSKMCSCCGNVKKELKLSERTYHCDVCGHEEDRDLNAAKNINAMGV